ncbi:hypothetical protein RJ55_03486 [Drechmeria coniospora]|nr:hypothetical protein RJ55_03486 [Drechmeria coniospora]
MTLFEQSLAFAEADATVSNQIGWGESTKLGGVVALTRAVILKRANTSPEVLLVAFLSTMTHITSQVLGIFDLQAKFRLLNTGFWGLCFMASIIWSVFCFELGNPSAQDLLRFPTVCIIGFVPHVLVLLGIIMCLGIYGLALVLSALSPPVDPRWSSMTLRQRLVHAHSNMQANVSVSDIRITREMDFYTALLRTGFAAITMASQAVYLNEDRGVSMQRHTWLEEARFREMEEFERQCVGIGLANSHHGQIGTIGLIPVKGGSAAASSGYARERAAQKLPKGRRERGLGAGTGAAERTSRWLMAIEFLLSISNLVARIGALCVLWSMGMVRIQCRPAWLLWLARRRKPTDDDSESAAVREGEAGSAWRRPTSFDGSGLIPTVEGVDVEAEFRRVADFDDEDGLDNELYRYWLKGGWWGSSDASGDFQPQSADFDWDNTSVVSRLSVDSDGESREDEWESEDGQSTPTRHSQHLSHAGKSFIFDTPLDMVSLARLLQPATREEREEAATLAAHLQSSVVMTRAAFQRSKHLQRSRVLTTIGVRPSQTAEPGRNTRLDVDEEEDLLEQLLLSRRRAPLGALGTGPSSVRHGGSEDGAVVTDSPPCVVCQSSPRTIIIWPCRCLSLCDDCRISLAMNNFDKCVCCRREVMSFSRIYVP